MSAAVSYHLDSLVTDELYQKQGQAQSPSQNQSTLSGYQNSLPLLAQIMPPNQQNQNSNPQYHDMYFNGYPENGQLYQNLSNMVNNYVMSTMPAVAPQPYQQQFSEKCTCKLNPNRIPRPRNAFILFRQKYHQLVLDELSEAKTNPEVLRELGRRWRALLPEERDHWNTLAEEEKKNHAKKYPNYRYTPRRNGKNRQCPACQQKVARAQNNQLQRQQQQHVPYQMNQHFEENHQVMQMQKLPLALVQHVPLQQYQLPQQYQLQQGQKQQLNSHMMLQMGLVYPTPYQMGQFGFEYQERHP